MNLLTSAEARQIAEATWGRGGTTTYKTNTRGTFYFSCSGHGGFVIDARVLSDDQRARLAQFVSFDSATRYFAPYGRVYGLMTPYRSKSFKVPYDHKTENFDIVLLEEDCAWSLAYVMTTIRRKDDLDEPRATEVAVAAAKTFWDWYDPTNPRVIADKNAELARKNNHPGLIVSARAESAGVTRVWTADQREHLVTGYDRARDEWGHPWLFLCETVDSISHESVAA